MDYLIYPKSIYKYLKYFIIVTLSSIYFFGISEY